MKKSLKRKFKGFLATLLAIAMVIAVPAYPAMAAELPAETLQPTEVASSYSELLENQVMPLSGTTYFIPDQEFSFSGTFVKSPFYVPTACQARMVIAAIGSEMLYVDVMNGRGECERTITVTPNQAQVYVFNISSGDHQLRFSSYNASIFTVRMQLYTWDY